MKEKEDRDEKFIRIPTVIFEALLRIDIRPKGHRLFLFICRKTFGWHKPWDGISQKQFAAATGIISNYDLQKELDILTWQNLILVRRKGKGKRTEYSIETNTKEWRSWNSKEYLKDRNLASTPREVPREIQKKGKLKPSVDGTLSVNATLGSLASTPRLQPSVNVTMTQKKLSKETIAKERDTDPNFINQINEAKNIKKRKEKEILEIKAILTEKGITNRQRKQCNAKISSLIEEVAEIERIAHEAETGKPITAKSEMTKNLCVTKSRQDPKPKKISSFDEADIAFSEIEK